MWRGGGTPCIYDGITYAWLFDSPKSTVLVISTIVYSFDPVQKFLCEKVEADISAACGRGNGGPGVCEHR